MFGILAVNWTLDWQNNSEPWDVSGFANQVTAWIVWIAATSKFWTIFSFLFAIGFVIQVERLRARNANVVSVYSRRLIVLFLIGAANFIFGPADIVYVYAMLGFLLLLMEKHPPTRILPALAITVMLLLWAHEVWTGRETTEVRVDAVVTVAAQVEADDMKYLWSEWQRVRVPLSEKGMHSEDLEFIRAAMKSDDKIFVAEENHLHEKRILRVSKQKAKVKIVRVNGIT